jgi:UPF0271 protein
MEIDLNCDLGEGCPHDPELMPLITSANIACAFHAGDAPTARAAAVLAAQFGVGVGAHPGFPDRDGFGRRELERSPDDVFADCVYQVGALIGLARSAGVALRHIKPHGAHYNMSCRADKLALPVIATAELFGLPLFGLPGSRLATLSAGRCAFVAEGFADRRYLPDGSLVPRSRPDAFVDDPDEAVCQASWLMRERRVRTLCVHGDNPRAVEFVHRLREALVHAGIAVRAFAAPRVGEG